MSIIYQVISSIILTYVCITMGVIVAWPSSTYTLFSSNSTTLDRPMTGLELSLLGSLSSISALMVAPFIGFLLDRLGRKNTFILYSLTQVIGWILVVSCNKVSVILTAIFIAGMNGSACLTVSVYVGEICQESIRGSMTSLSMTFFSIGTLLSYIIGGFLEYKIMNYVILTLAALGLLMLTFVKESPVYLMKVNKQKEAEKSLAFYRRALPKSKEVQSEIESIKRIINPVLDENMPEEERLNPDLQSSKKLSTWMFLKKSKSSRRALLLSTVLFTAADLQGLVAVQVYASPLFEEAMPNISSTMPCILFALTAIISGFAGAYLVEKVGRRFLMIYASLVTGVLCILLGTQIQIQWGPHWLTVVMMLLYCVGYCLGAGIVPYAIIGETFLPEIKGFASMLVVEWSFVCNFTILFIFNPIVSNFGLWLIFYIFAAACFLSAIYCIFFLPETKGLKVEVIQTLLSKRANK